MLDFVNKSYYRRKTNELAAKETLFGIVVDLGGGKRSSYLNHFVILPKTKLVSINYNRKDKPDVLADLEKKIPVRGEYADIVLAFNLLEHIFNEKQLLAEARRILKTDGKFFAATPFIKEIHNDPSDYYRLTPAAWIKLLSEAGFKKIEMIPISAGPLIACYTLLQAVLPKPLLFLLYPVCFASDQILLKIRPIWKEIFLVGIFIKATK
jgi:SAM-dependent methyltransferase